ncbi:hypothetical protein MTR67_031243 [Solanum verrucosum]|uniref:Uncharacterized protein n=1 Tax=Solanum verrucosum TaxID=315347 RepID=A0AAF0U232_SOLVR|nr:hypothetical protein MTR67_031243 [Solanum verrucosum]
MLKIYELPIYLLLDVAEWVIPEYIMYDEVEPPKFKRPLGRLKKKPRAKTTHEMLGLKEKMHIAHVELRGTIGVHVEIDFKKFNEFYTSMKLQIL